MRSALVLLSSLALLFCTVEAGATVSVAIDLTHQRMHVVSSRGSFDWAISSARSGFYTPGGSFAPTYLERMHYSKKYHMSPMPYSIFFRGGFAIHGTYAVGELGRPASHGCVRLSPQHAAALYGMVLAEGARISISGTPPASRPFGRRYEARRHPPMAGARLARRGYRVGPGSPRSYEDPSDPYASYAYPPAYVPRYATPYVYPDN